MNQKYGISNPRLRSPLAAKHELNQNGRHGLPISHQPLQLNNMSSDNSVDYNNNNNKMKPLPLSRNYSIESDHSIHDLADPRKQARKTKIRLGTIDTKIIEHNINNSIVNSKFRGFTMHSSITGTGTGTSTGTGSGNVTTTTSHNNVRYSNYMSSPDTTFRFNNRGSNLDSRTADVNQALTFGFLTNKSNHFGKNSNSKYNSGKNKSDTTIDEIDDTDQNLHLLSPLVKIGDDELMGALGNESDGTNRTGTRLSATVNTDHDHYMNRTITPFHVETDN